MPPKKPSPLRHEEKLQFSLGGWKKIQSLIKKAEVQTFADLMRTAIAMLDWYLEKKGEGYTLMIEKDGKHKTVELRQGKPYLPN